ncbi:IclR family transcriptional regulator [Sphingobium sp. LB126]|uniref:IclR family transcriptional regulator n=1 Tax=Sphingobium sp. LB126 TaxID=1983755 RepID=UPI0024133C94|nr:IclR family transcriptional regulator [Sphingobium sp. LB126]
MVRNGTPSIAALSRSLAMLEAILNDRDGRSVAAIAELIDMPVATAHRQVTTLVAEGFLARMPRGRLGPGRRLLSLMQSVDEKQLIVAAAAPVLHRLAASVRSVVQLGTLENDMVTYRIKTGRGASDFFTKVGMQLEAYCSGIGKVLLAYQTEQDREAYLATGPFPALTSNTITDPELLRKELARVRAAGVARDAEEIVEGLACLAVPIHSMDGHVRAAISVSRAVPGRKEWQEDAIVEMLRTAAVEIEASL